MAQISVIVPVYKVEKYIHHCVDSILGQTFSDFELILVDDGSPDGCPAICDEYAAKDERVRVIHKPNGGLASARNAGLEIVSGKYILFCDSDDYVTADWCEQFLPHVSAAEDNYIFGGERQVKVTPTEVTISKPTMLDRNSWDISDYLSVGDLGFACNVLYYTSVIQKHHIRFPEEVIVEDLPFNFAYVQHMNRITYTGKSGYFYVLDERESLSRKYYPNMFRKWQEKYQATQAFIDKMIPEEKQETNRQRIANKYLFLFLQSLNYTLDDRNPASFPDKLKYNIHVVKTAEFQHCLYYADSSREDKRVIRLLKKKNYMAVFLMQKLSQLKRQIFKGVR